MHIAILTGGISDERTVAIRSASNMKTWCETAGHTTEAFDFPSDLQRFLKQYQTAALAKYFPTKALKDSQAKHPDFDLVIPMFHGVYGEDGQVTAFLKTLDYHTAYSPFETHALCIDKYKTNLFVAERGVKIPKTLFLEKNTPAPENMPIAYPVIVKPNKGGSSIATNKTHTSVELQKAISEIQDDDILIQACIVGREFTVGVYHDATGYHALPIIEIITLKETFFNYSEKYETDGSNELFLEGEESFQKTLNEASETIARYLRCTGVVRIDYLYDGREIYFLEVNTIPGFTSGSLIPKMWKKAGKNETEFIEMLNF